jgi:hypothetical protein
MFVLLGLSSFTYTVYAILCLVAAGKVPVNQQGGPEAKSILIGTGIFFIVAMVIDIVHCCVFRAYINKYKTTYNLTPSIVGYSQPMVAAHRV